MRDLACATYCAAPSPAQVLKSGGNVLLLDEPTNDLDVNTMRSLEEVRGSVEAERRLLEMNVSRARRKTLIDQVAAMIILERYLSERQSSI